jgi:hypothetical protein
LIKERYERDPILGWELLTFLMHIEHNLFYMYKYMADSRIKIDAQTKDLMGELAGYFELYHNAFLKNDMSYINRINKLSKEYQFGRCHKAIAEAQGDVSVIHSYIRESFRLMQIGTSPIMSMLLKD